MRLLRCVAAMFVCSLALTGQVAVIPTLDCIEVLNRSTGASVLQTNLSAGVNVTATFSPAIPGSSRVTLNPGAANAESLNNNSSSASALLTFTPVFSHAAGEPVVTETVSFLAHFGYFNPTTQTGSYIAGGSTNFLSPGNPNQGQPSVFPPGYVKRAFSVPFFGPRDRIWILNNQFAVARPEPAFYCPDSRSVPWIEGRTITLNASSTNAGLTLGAAGVARDPAAALSLTSQPALYVAPDAAAAITSEVAVTNLAYQNGAITGDVAVAPTSRTRFAVPLQATASDGTAGYGMLFVDVRTNCALTVTPATLPLATQNSPYAPVAFGATGGASPYTFTLESALPQGMTFAGGLLNGTPAAAGAFPVTLLVTDSGTCMTRVNYTLNVAGPSCAANVTPQVQVTLGGLRRNLVTGRWLQTVTLRNPGATAIAGPFALTLDSLSANASLYNASGQTACAAPLGRPYVLVPAGSDDILSPAETAAVTLEFVNTQASTPITYTPRVLAGGTQR